MIIKKLTLYNYRAFSGINVFDLENKKNKPLNIFEAQNSHGTTTFIEQFIGAYLVMNPI